MIFLKILIIFLCVAGIFFSFLTLAGTFLITLSYFFYGLATKFDNFNFWLLFLLFLLSVVGEVIEFFSAAIGGKHFGASNISFFTTLAFGIIGGIWGTFLLPVVGTLMGTLIGATLAAFSTEYMLKGKFEPALKASIGVLAGKTGSILVKTLLSLIMTVLVTISIFSQQT
jgi:uncharacterized protein